MNATHIALNTGFEGHPATLNPRHTRGSSTALIDKIILALVGSLACIPFGELHRFDFARGRIDLFEFAYLVLLPVLLFGFIVKRGRGDFRPLIWLLFCLALGYWPLLLQVANQHDVLVQTRLFLPLTVGCVL